MSAKNTPYLQAIMWLLVLLVCATPGARALLPWLGTAVLVSLVVGGLLVIAGLLLVGCVALLAPQPERPGNDAGEIWSCVRAFAWGLAVLSGLALASMLR